MAWSKIPQIFKQDLKLAITRKQIVTSFDTGYKRKSNSIALLRGSKELHTMFPA